MLDLSVIPPSHSADVRIELVIGGESFPVAATGPDYVVLSDPTDLRPCDGEVIMTIDGRRHHWPVRLYIGAEIDDPVVLTEPLEPATGLPNDSLERA